MQTPATTLTTPRSAAGSTRNPVPNRSKSSQARTICVSNVPQNCFGMSTPQIRNGSIWHSLKHFFGVRPARTVSGSRLGPVSRHAAGRLTASTPVRGPVIHSVALHTLWAYGYNQGCRGVAQYGSARRSGRRGPGFKSQHPDHFPRQAAAGDALDPFRRVLRKGSPRACCRGLRADWGVWELDICLKPWRSAPTSSSS